MAASVEDASEVSDATGDELVLASTVSLSGCNSIKEDVLLMCREVIVSNVEHPERKETILLLFDQGSQKSYIHDELATRLGVKRTSESW